MVKRIQTIDDIDWKLEQFFLEGAGKVNELYDHPFDWKNFDFLSYARNHLFLVCYKNGTPQGAMLARCFSSVFDSNTRILFQDLLYVKDQSPRVAHCLLKEFIDFGKNHANHIISTVGVKTNIKGRSLKKLGFEELETLYRIRV